MGKIVGLVFKAEKQYTCPVCGKEYKSAEALAKHQKEKHPEPGGEE